MKCRRHQLISIAALLAACANPLEPLDLAEGCNPLLAGADCLMPYPSDFFVVADPTTPTARSIRVTGPAVVRTENGLSGDITRWRAFDGFSRLPTIVTTLGAEVSPRGLPAVLHGPQSSLLPAESVTLIVHAETGRFIPHFTDLDPRATDPLRQAIVLHPLEPLEEHARYVVAIHDARGPDGAVVAAPEGFRRLRDRQASGDPVLEPMLDRFETEVFDVLTGAGVQRSTLQLAWDFTTGADEHVTGDMFRVRDLTIAALARQPADVVIDRVEPGTDGVTWRVIHGTIGGPRFVDDDGPAGRLVRDADGRVATPTARTRFAFTALIPESALSATTSVPFVGYGHGFFQDRAELQNYGTPTIASSLPAVFVSIDWIGMSRGDLGHILSSFFDEPSTVMSFTDRVHQAMANWITLSSAFDGTLAAQPEFQHPQRGSLIYDTREMYFLGISMGHIFGGVQAALNPRIKRYALEVGGAGFTMMMFRAQPFLQFLFALSSVVPDPLDQQKVVATSQRHFDRIDPGIYAPYVFDNPRSDSPDRQLLLQVGIGDRLVPNFASFFHARALGLGLTAAGPEAAWGIEVGAHPERGAVTVFDFDEDTSFYATAEPTRVDNGVHGDVRLLEASQSQLRTFFTPDGTVVHPCAGPCRAP